jgi:hypothetical protein
LTEQWYERVQERKRVQLRIVLSIMGMMVGACLLFAGLVMLRNAADLQARASAIDGARLLEPNQAAAAFPELVCIEGAVPVAERPLTVSGSARPWLAVRRVSRGVIGSTRDGGTGAHDPAQRVRRASHTERVERFMIGPVAVLPRDARLDTLVEIGDLGDHVVSGIPADASLTVVGFLEGGTIHDGEPFVVAAMPTRKPLVRHLRSEADRVRRLGPFVAGFGGLMILAALVWVRWGR